MIYAYLRTSTADQVYGIDAQREAISRLYTPDEWYEEHASGKDIKGRPVFTELLNRLEPGDTLVVSKLDRFARSVSDAVTIANDLQQRKVNLVVLDMQLDLASPMGKLVFSVLAAVAEFERNMISVRTADGMAAAKRSGRHVGRPRTSTRRRNNDLTSAQPSATV